MQRSSTIALLPGLLLALCAGSALAADNGKINTLGNASTKAPIMSREELRACLKQQDALKARAEDGKTKRTQLDVERKQLEADKDAIAAEHAALAARIEKVASDFNAKVAEQSKTVEEFNAKMDAMNKAAAKGDNVDRQRQKLEREGKAIQQASDDLNAQNKTLNDQIAADKAAFDTKNTAFQARADDWNARNRTMDTTAAEYDMDLDAWKKQCGGRNYREIDEKVIRSGG
ncbi:hypothetical protein [Ideonella oryzae]|uniref:Chromosome partition protein Smc n=1 Tax=Ideonella oryzae TaxID=2937441 RepID=A0ABT1BJ59_9BURK|nr:hypothetical protein [Ideonella oryzae]MCO5976235.1 hypothetical protein [Ideonella oryzae]